LSIQHAESAPGWLIRSLRIVVIAEWVSLLIGVLSSATVSVFSPFRVLTAAILAGIFVAMDTLLPVATKVTPGLRREIFMVAGSLLTVSAATLTGGASSPYLLLALTPVLFSSLVEGYRAGLTTSLLSAALITAITIASDGIAGVAAAAVPIALFPLMALVVAQIRRLLVELEERASSLEQATLQAEAELSRLAQKNDLLRRLTDLYGYGDHGGPVELSRTALKAIIDAGLASFATATMFDTQGPVVVARAGTDSPDLIRTQIPLGEGETTTGVVSLAGDRALTTVERMDIDRLLRPVAASFINAVLLQEIASTAVKQERLRLARELHDEIGPALAALGLALDASLLESRHDRATEDGLLYVRNGLEQVVDDLRGTIADLRSEKSASLTASLSRTVGVHEGPDLRIEIHERRPPPGTVLRQILAIVTEAVRNAINHSDATSVAVIGTADRGVVEIEVRDNGGGFSPTEVSDGHFGLLGMRERADRIGAVLEINSDTTGTTVRLLWKERK
jgi:signal transduction histidine kinase